MGRIHLSSTRLSTADDASTTIIGSRARGTGGALEQ
jgi:hypothetical protein